MANVFIIVVVIYLLTDLRVIMKTERNVLNCNENNVTMQIIIMVIF